MIISPYTTVGRDIVPGRDSDASTSCTTLLKPTKYLQESIKANIKTLAAYLVKESALEAVQAALDRISNAYNRHV